MDRIPTLGVVIPCYNEGRRLPVKDYRDFISGSGEDIAFLFVNDGSSDNTLEVLNSLKKELPGRINILDLEKNQGKAEAVRQGMLWLRGNKELDYYGFFDADLSTPLAQLTSMKDHIARFNSPAALIGSRVKIYGTTQIIRSESRHYIGRIVATLISRTLKLAIYDTQCGFKLFRVDVIHTLFDDPFISRWLFDVEILFRLKNCYGETELKNQLFEIPVDEWYEKGGSKIPLSYIFKVPTELFKIKSRYTS